MHYETARWVNHSLLFTLSLHYHYCHFIQTLIHLDLAGNQISDTGAQYLADALRNSKVSQSLFPLHSLSLHYHYCHFIQTLTHLDLAGNQISDAMRKYLVNTLGKGKVGEYLKNESINWICFFLFWIGFFLIMNGGNIVSWWVEMVMRVVWYCLWWRSFGNLRFCCFFLVKFLRKSLSDNHSFALVRVWIKENTGRNRNVW
jgi:hypothetical protein